MDQERTNENGGITVADLGLFKLFGPSLGPTNLGSHILKRIFFSGSVHFPASHIKDILDEAKKHKIVY